MNLPEGIEIGGIQLYGYPSLETDTPKEEPQKGPINVVFLTSLRDIAADDRAGTITNIPRGPSYMMGLIEAVNLAIKDCYHNLGDFIKIGGVITDDLLVTDLTTPLPTYKTSGKQWIYPLEERTAQGETLGNLTEHIPSTFRREIDKDERRFKRKEFEEELYQVSQEMGADIIISDHLMIKIIYLLHKVKYGIGKILNIHPGITDPIHPGKLLGATPTMDAIRNAKSLETTFDKDTRLYKPSIKTGATLHVMGKRVDEGSVIASSGNTKVNSSDRRRDLRYRNYPVKFQVFVQGIIHYIRTMFPVIDNLDLSERGKMKRVIPFLVDQYREKRPQTPHPILDRKNPSR